MTQNKRITLNIIATYGRSLYALVLGLFSGRWALMALGQVDYGLIGVVGGLTVFISFFNTILASSVSRFYAFSVGEAQKDGAGESGLEECRRWFNTALFIHTIVPTILIIVGYPIGIWAVKSFLTIPPDRINASVWVFRFVCISCFVGMLNVPFSAMYTAKQYIAELTIYGVVSSTVNVIFLYFMVTHPGEWLVKYAGWTCLISIVPQIIIMLRATRVFPECRVDNSYLFDVKRLKRLFRYAWWQMVGTLGWMFQSQGIAIIVNKFFGPVYNASMNVAATMTGHANALTSSVIGAFVPAITQSCGAKRKDEMMKMAYMADKFGFISSLIFFLPLSIELKEVVHLWLKNPPPATVGLCLIVMIGIVANNATIGFSSAIMANGKIALSQTLMGGVLMATLPVAWILCCLGFSVYFVAIVVASAFLVNTFLRAVFARLLLGMSIRKWFFGIIVPASLVVIISLIGGLISLHLFKPSLGRVVLTTTCVEIVFIPMVWFFLFDNAERQVVMRKVSGTIVQLHR